MAAVALLLVSAGTDAQEFRSIRRIRAAHGQSALAGPVEQQVVTRALERIVAAWNTPAMRGLLGSRFYDADRLSDNLASLPRDATLRLLAVQAVRVLRQERRPGADGRPDRRVSLLSVVARTQVEFEDPALGFRRLEGTNEYVFSVIEVEE